MRPHRPVALAALLVAGLTAPAGVALAAGHDEPPPASAGPVPTGSPAPAVPLPATPATAVVAGPGAPTTAAPAPSAATSGAADEVAVNQPPVAVDDPPARLVAGRTAVLGVLANDTDDGLGRPAEEPAHLEIATFTGLGGRVSTGPDRRVLRFTARPADAGRTFTVSYTATDGTLVSDEASAPVGLDAPPAARRVSLVVPSRLVALRTSTLHGSVRPLTPRPVTVRVQRLVAGRWTALRTDRAGRDGRYAVLYSTNRPQRLTVRAVATWRDGRRAVSGRRARTVVAVPDVRVSGPLTRSAVRWSYRTGCPVTPRGLRRISINRFTYRHVVARGSLVVRASAVPDLVRVFRASFRDRFPLRSMRPSDAFYAHGRRTPTQSDLAAMRADNTSAFNCRSVTGNPYRISQHSYGNAIDINTVRNPYVVGGRVFPSFARTYLDRSRVRPGMILRGGTIASTMRRNGWPWGARWSHPDYQHFSANGG